MDINYQYTKRRSDFGKQPLFCEQGPDMCDSIAACKPEQKLFILRNPVHQQVQNTPAYSEHQINTIRAEVTQTACNHTEGGWPRDVNIHDIEQTQRYRRKIEKDDNYIHCVMRMYPAVEHYVLQNNAIDIYRSYYTEMKKLPPIEHSSCRTVNVFRDKHNRPAAALAWNPEAYRFAVCYTDVDVHNQARSTTFASIWDVDNFNDPETILDPHVAMFDLRYNPFDCNMMLGGLTTGQTCVFDPRTGGEPTLSTPAHKAHRDLVRKLRFIHSKTNSEFISSSPDGCCKWWDLRNLEQPYDEIIIDLVQSPTDVPSLSAAFGVAALEYEPTMPSRFMVGTDNGLIIGGNRKGKTPVEKLPSKFNAHLGPVWAVERNPGFVKNFLSIGDWRFRVWSEDCREGPIMWCPMQRSRPMCGGWSPTRFSQLLLGTVDGGISVWDLLRGTQEPVLTMQLDSLALISHAYHQKGGLVALGSRSGKVHLVQMATNLRASEKNDKALMTAIFDRESKRERTLEARLREIRLKLKQTEGEEPPITSVLHIDAVATDAELNDVANDYFATVKKELTLL